LHAKSPVPEPDLIELFVRPLHASGALYLVAGSLGSMLYSEPRLTLDVDLAVALDEAQLSALAKIYAAPDYYCPPPEVLFAENKRECRGHFNIIHIPSGLKADFYPSQHDVFFDWAWEHRRTVSQGSGTVHYAPAEYIIVWKVAYYREGGSEKHVRDVLRMRDLAGDEIDVTILAEELSRRGLWGTYQSMIHE